MGSNAADRAHCHRLRDAFYACLAHGGVTPTMMRSATAGTSGGGGGDAAAIATAAAAAAAEVERALAACATAKLEYTAACPESWRRYWADRYVAGKPFR